MTRRSFVPFVPLWVTQLGPGGRSASLTEAWGGWLNSNRAMDDLTAYERLLLRFDGAPVAPDNDWLNETAQLIFEVPLSARQPQVVSSPGGYPYFALWPRDGDESSQPASVSEIFEFAIENHLGIVFFGADRLPKWELTHGQVLAWQLYGVPNPPRFWNMPPDGEGESTATEVEFMQVGAPSEEMLPPLVRSSLRWAMTERLRISNPRVGLVKRQGEPGGRLVFDLDPERFGGNEGAATAYRFLVWYFPYCIPSLGIPSMAGASWMVPL